MNLLKLIFFVIKIKKWKNDGGLRTQWWMSKHNTLLWRSTLSALRVALYESPVRDAPVLRIKIPLPSGLLILYPPANTSYFLWVR